MLYIKCILLLQVINLLNANENNRQILYWNSFQPGQLLHSLNQLTADIDAKPMQAYVSTTMTPAQQRVDNDVASSNSDYDRAYDDFVGKYCSETVNSAFSQEENSGSAEEDALTGASRTSQRKQQKCKKVRRKRETCVICRNERTGEKSETCSYASESTPQEYSYEKARNYKKTRQSSNENEGVSDEAEKEAEYEDEDYDEEEAATTTQESGSCTRKRKHDKVCYFCINSAGEKMKECTKLTNTSKRRGNDKNDKLKKSQRIYKRTLSFTYENNNSTDGNAADKTELNTETVDSTKAPQLRKKVIVKVLKRKKTLN